MPVACPRRAERSSRLVDVEQCGTSARRSPDAAAGGRRCCPASRNRAAGMPCWLLLRPGGPTTDPRCRCGSVTPESEMTGSLFAELRSSGGDATPRRVVPGPTAMHHPFSSNIESRFGLPRMNWCADPSLRSRASASVQPARHRAFPASPVTWCCRPVATGDFRDSALRKLVVATLRPSGPGLRRARLTVDRISAVSFPTVGFERPESWRGGDPANPPATLVTGASFQCGSVSRCGTGPNPECCPSLVRCDLLPTCGETRRLFGRRTRS